jgi:phage terminase large subunit-like protein
LTPEPTFEAYALAQHAPDFDDSLSAVEDLVNAYDFASWLRPDQRIPRGDWRSFGFLSARGWGKSFAIAVEFNRRVEAGECHAPALMAPSVDRVRDVQVDFIVATSPPWFRAVACGDGVRWPNGVEAIPFTPEAPGRPRSGNFDFSWLCELVDWPASTQMDAYQNLATATRVGKCQIVWDTTSKGKNRVIQHLLGECARDPIANRVQRGVTFDNPLLSRKYLKALVKQYVQGSRRYQEEIGGKVFAESAGALWQQAWLDDHRRAIAPTDPDLVLVSIDPSQSAGEEADEAGIGVVMRDRLGEYYVTDDHSGKLAPEAWANIAVNRCARDAAGFVYERNNAGDLPRDLIKVIAEARGFQLREVTDRGAPFPSRMPGVIWFRCITSTRSKEARAEPIAELYRTGRVHHVGIHDLLELEQTTWEPGSKSPNRLDAICQGVAELAGVRADRPRKDDNAIQNAAKAQRHLHSLLIAGGGRRIGL